MDVNTENIFCSIQMHDVLMAKTPRKRSSVNSTNLYINGMTWSWITSCFDSDVWETLPIQSHQVCSYDRQKEDALFQAIERIYKKHPNQAHFLEKYMKNIFWMELKADQTKKDLITSSSFPVLPYTVFISSKALRHIPPNSVSPTPSIKFLAENLLHEAVHQKVNLLLLNDSVLASDYDSKLSPKISIYWRKNHEARNQEWEIDRVFHAMQVYAEVILFRAQELNTEDLTDNERQNFANALFDAKEVLSYLNQQIQLYSQCFNSRGLVQLDELDKKIKKVLTI